ncbi:MAG: GGDEF domain-containing protein [Actinomycetota bacterium]|nr:GGDEF domain-containing protein [Actinomycetota bacterium]
MNLNGFKAVNDTHGHDVGDQVLRQFAERLTGLLRPRDTAARLGGDEFAVLCPDTDSEQAGRVADRLEAAAALPFRLSEHVTVQLTAAVGISTQSSPSTGARTTTTSSSPDEGGVGSRDADHELLADAAALLRHADQQMYRTKRRSNAASDTG